MLVLFNLGSFVSWMSVAFAKIELPYLISTSTRILQRCWTLNTNCPQSFASIYVPSTDVLIPYLRFSRTYTRIGNNFAVHDQKWMIFLLDDKPPIEEMFYSGIDDIGELRPPPIQPAVNDTTHAPGSLRILKVFVLTLR